MEYRSTCFSAHCTPHIPYCQSCIVSSWKHSALQVLIKITVFSTIDLSFVIALVHINKIQFPWIITIRKRYFVSYKISHVPEICSKRDLLETFLSFWKQSPGFVLSHKHNWTVTYKPLLNQAEISPCCYLFLDTKILEYYLNCEREKLRKYIKISIWDYPLGEIHLY